MAIDTHKNTDADAAGQPDRYGSILNSLDAGVLVVDSDSKITYRNRTASTLPGGESMDDAFHNVTFVERFSGWRDVLGRVTGAGGSVQLTGTLPLGAPGDASTITVSCTPHLGANGGLSGGAIVLFLLGATDASVSYSASEVEARLTTLGKMAARVAHELNNPLDGILRYVNLSLRLIAESSETKLTSYLSESRTGLLRMMQIVGDLLEYSRATGGSFDTLGINETVEQAIRAVSPAAEANGVVVAVDFQSGDLPAIVGTRLMQVCCNLMKNAIDAMPDGGRLSITTGLVSQDIVIRIEDTGPGLPEPIEQVFEPFFTTKDVGSGTGLGLAICKDFVDGLNGTLRAINGRDGGAVFTISLPMDSCAPPLPKILGGTRTSQVGGTQTVHRGKKGS